MSKERLGDREFIESIKEYSVYEHMREGFIVPKETYLRLVIMADNFITINHQHDTCTEIQEEMIRTQQQNKRYREALKKIRDLWHKSTDATDDTHLAYMMARRAAKELLEESE